MQVPYTLLSPQLILVAAWKHKKALVLSRNYMQHVPCGDYLYKIVATRKYMLAVYHEDMNPRAQANIQHGMCKLQNRRVIRHLLYRVGRSSLAKRGKCK
jgi:deoxycytidylate deaminase